MILVFAGKLIFSINRPTGEVVACNALRGGRPLSVCTTPKRIYYGEYGRNPERKPMSVWASSDGGVSWSKAWTFENIRHVHGVFQNPHDGSIWITTGDSDEESIIWRTEDEFETVQKVVSDGQQSRAVSLVFSESAVVYGTDIPDRPNTLRKYDCVTAQTDTLAEVDGPVFFSANVNGRTFFSTSVEKENIQRIRDVRVYVSDDWANWHKVLNLRKDCLSPVYFQHGQARFAMGQGDGASVWITPFATKHDHQSIRLVWK